MCTPFPLPVRTDVIKVSPLRPRGEAEVPESPPKSARPVSRGGHPQPHPGLHRQDERHHQPGPRLGVGRRGGRRAMERRLRLPLRDFGYVSDSLSIYHIQSSARDILDTFMAQPLRLNKFSSEFGWADHYVLEEHRTPGRGTLKVCRPRAKHYVARGPS